MPLIVGTNTYATESYLEEYAAARGITITGTPSVLLIKAMDYFATIDDRWQGERTSASQTLAWPRTGVYLYGSLFADDGYPTQLIDAQCMLAIYADAGVNLIPVIGVGAAGSVIEKTVDVVSVKYAEGHNNTQPIFVAVNGLLKPLMRNNGGINFAVRASV